MLENVRLKIVNQVLLELQSNFDNKKNFRPYRSLKMMIIKSKCVRKKNEFINLLNSRVLSFSLIHEEIMKILQHLLIIKCTIFSHHKHPHLKAVQFPNL